MDRSTIIGENIREVILNGLIAFFPLSSRNRPRSISYRVTVAHDISRVELKVFDSFSQIEVASYNISELSVKVSSKLLHPIRKLPGTNKHTVMIFVISLYSLYILISRHDCVHF